MDSEQAIHIIATFVGGVLACALVHASIHFGYVTDADTATSLAAAITFAVSHGWPYFAAWIKPKLAP